MAKRIVERYHHLGRGLRTEEKRGLIQAILKPKLLNESGHGYLDSLVQRLSECGFSEQQVYGIIINLGVNGRIIDENGCSFSNFLRNDTEAFQRIKEGSDRVEKDVSTFTIIIAASEYLNEAEQQQLKRRFANKGKEPRHIYVAKRMIEEYIPDQPKGRKNSLMFNLLELKFETNSREARRNTERVFLKALGLENSERNDSDNVERSSNEDLINRVEKEYGINREFLEQKSIANIAAAVEIVEGYCFEKELGIEGKRALIQQILSSSWFGRRMEYALPSLLDKFQQIGFEEQARYGIMINLFLNGITTDCVTYTYSDLLSNHQKAWNAIKTGKNAIQTKVIIGPLTMNRLMQKAGRITKKSVYNNTRGGIGDQSGTRARLNKLVQSEKTSREINTQLL